MKKLLAMLLAVTVFGATLAGCGSKGEEPAAPAEETEAPADAEEPAEAETEAPEATPAGEEDTMTMDEVIAAVQASDVPKDLKLGYVCMNLANPWFVQVVEGFNDACKEMGLSEPLTIDSQYDVDKQVSDVETLVNDNYNAIMISPIDQNALESIVTTANEAGIVTSCAAQSVDISDFRYICEEYSYGQAIGKNAANWINENLADQEEVQVCLITQDNVADTIARADGIQDTLEAECKNINIVARQAGDTPELGLQIVESTLAAYPDLQVVVASNDSGGIGGYQAMVNAGYTGDDPVAVFSGDATDEALNNMLEENTIYRGTVDLFPYACGYESAYQLVYYIMNGKPAATKTVIFDPVLVPLADLLDGTYKYDPS
ncbi:sugar ABC transporter substrate-binding protein [Candidatus Merdisoma sp. JLR.KK006]|uniref:sugar ABC transporter substrate-binding protein n=1 Tax=Candidatus Merdisoma sp. JLR.KK006 TaxID=3112626 RepID=UPI002FF341E9